MQSLKKEMEDNRKQRDDAFKKLVERLERGMEKLQEKRKWIKK